MGLFFILVGVGLIYFSYRNSIAYLKQLGLILLAVGIGALLLAMFNVNLMPTV